MSNTISYDFTNPLDFSFDTDDIEIVAGKAQLKNQVGNANFTEGFTSDSGFTYDSSKAEFTGGLVRKKDQRPANATFGATYTYSIDGSWGGGILTGNAVGGATITGGKLDLTGGGKYVSYIATNNSNFTQTGTIKFKFTPNYSGYPAANSYIFSIAEATGLNNQLYLYHSTTGRLYFIAYDSSGNPIINTFFDTWSAVSGTEYEFELNLDFTGGNLRLFINGTQQSTTKVGTGTRTSASTKLIIGASSAGGGPTDCYIDGFVVFNTVQHTANYASGYTLPDYKYLLSNVTLPEMEHTLPGTLFSINSITSTESGSPRYTLQIGRSGNYLYWDGSAWSTSDGSYSQASPISDFNTHKELLDVDGEIYVQFKIHFTESNTQSSVDNLIINLSMNTGYLTTNPTIQSNTNFSASELINFISTEIITGSDQIKHVVVVGGVDKYWDGGAVVTSNGTYAQSNTAAEILTNIGAFLSTRHLVYIKSFLHSNDGTTTPQLDEIEIEYTSALANPNLPELIQLEGFLNGHNGPIASQMIYIRPYQFGFQNIDIVHFYGWETLATTNADGWFSSTVFIQPNQKYWEIKIGIKKYIITLESGKINDLSKIDYEVSNG